MLTWPWRGAGFVQCHAPVCRPNATAALLMSFRTAISFKDAENLLVVLIRRYSLHLVKPERWSRIGVVRDGRGGCGGVPVPLAGERVGRCGIN